MQTIIIVLDSNKMENPDLDIRYLLPDKIEEFTNGLARDNGYDYLDDARLGIWLSFFISWSKKKWRRIPAPVDGPDNTSAPVARMLPSKTMVPY